MTPRLYLSPPDLRGNEEALLLDALRSGWVAPLGPHVNAFEEELAARVGSPHAAALASGTAALHLALILSDVQPGDRVYASSLTFVATLNPIRYLGAEPVLFDAEPTSWNLDPNLLEEALRKDAATGRLPKALVLVHLYGQSADTDRIADLCDAYGITLIEDAAEALGATYRDTHPGSRGRFGLFSFNGNKIITSSGGGMLVGQNEEDIARARKLATQAREPAPHYEHAELGYNYRLSNLCAAVGRAQLATLDARVARRRAIFERYVHELAGLPGLRFQPEAPWGQHTRWLTCLTIDPDAAGSDRESIRLALEVENIESRPLWKPMHQQPLYQDCTMHGGDVSDGLFRTGLCLPSGSSMSDADQDRVIACMRNHLQ